MKRYIYIIIVCFSAISCQKDFLDKKPSKSLLVPTTLKDFESLLDNQEVYSISPSLPVIASDDFYAPDAKLNSFNSPFQKNSYIWANDIDEGLRMSDWNVPYEQVFYSNIILDALNKNEASFIPNEEHRKIRGAALFHRAFAFYNLVQMYAVAYNASTAKNDLGLPIRLEADVNLKSARASLQETYDRIITDLSEAISILPPTSSHQSRPNKVAALALLSRLYLTMGDYPKALNFANETLQINSSLIDYNSLNATTTVPFPVSPNSNNLETIFYARQNTYTFGGANNTTVEPSLYDSYNSNDLRKSIYFVNGSPSWFKGRYTGNLGRLFGGITTGEIYLIRAECEARIGSIQNAMGDLNTLMKKRWRNTVPFPEFTASNSEEALTKILIERRKELVFRGLRWSDLRRLNKDPRFAKNISRIVENKTYVLEYNSLKYTFPIPTQEVLSSGIQQNER